MKVTLALKFCRVKNSEIGINRSDCRDIDVISRKMALFCIFLEHIETRAAVLLNTLNGKLCRKKNSIIRISHGLDRKNSHSNSGQFI